MAGFPGQGVLNKDPAVWLDDLTCQHLYPNLPPKECYRTGTQHTHPQKFQVFKNSDEICQITYENDIQFGDNSIQWWKIAK